ncbi:MAG TPA: TonB-dependent receptor, partial [Leptospiraceae bacterium]|nr:TonB-dependent receptor [Leptospiraceae bacterium]
TEKLSLSARLYGDTFLKKDQIQVERPDMINHIGMSPIKKTGYKYDTKGTEVILQYNPLSQLSIMLGAQLEKLTYKDAYVQKNFAGNNTSNLYPFFYDFDNLDRDRNDTILAYFTTGKAFVSDPESLQKGKTKSRNIQAEFLQVLWDPFKWLSITMGVRRDVYSDFGSTINPKSGFVLTPFEKTRYGSLSFKFLLGSAFRAPTFKEMYDRSQTYQFGGVLGNNTERFQNYGQAGYGPLKPETIRTGEVGMEYQTPYKPLNIQANWYYTRIYNNIDGVNVSSTPPGKLDIYHNLRGLTILGTEVEAKLSFSKRNYIFANVSWFQAVDHGGLNGIVTSDTKTFLTSIPQARANLGVNWNLFKYFILNNTIWASSERQSNARFAFERLSTKGFQYSQYYIWNVSLGTTEELNENLEFRFSIFNLNNYKLYDHSNTATEDYNNRAIPAAYIYQRYIEFKVTYFIK